MAKIVVALGGNALGNSPKEQLELVKNTAKPLVDLIEEGNTLVITHGNGPQVGMINLAFANDNVVDMPFPECGAMSQGYIGYHLQNQISEELKNRGIKTSVSTVITQVIVAEDDPAFKNPTKPIGAFYSEEEAKKIAEEKSYIMKEDSGRGYRRVVASPKPVGIAELDVIKTLIDSGVCVIAAGGGGIPVIKKNNALEGVAAVIDKDFASAKLASEIGADMLIILTAVDRVKINFGSPDEKDLAEVAISELKDYIKEGHFAPGSMLPKVEAAIEFAASSKGRTALITSLMCAKDGIQGKTGTKIRE